MISANQPIPARINSFYCCNSGLKVCGHTHKTFSNAAKCAVQKTSIKMLISGEFVTVWSK